MNKRLTELFDQSVDYTKLQPNGTFEFSTDKFAKLMVEEFQTILRDNSGADTGTLSYRVEEHFKD